MGLFSSKKKYATVSTTDIIKPKKVVNNKTVASNLWEKCDECGECIKKCPYSLNIPQLLKENIQDYENILNGKTIVD